MPAIEIKTVHNVILSYKTATLLDRILAFCIDSSIAFVLFIFAFMLEEFIFKTTNETVTMVAFMLIFSLYHISSETLLNGQSLGKMIMGIRVVKLNGRAATFQDYFMRWVFRLVDILFSLGSMACILVSSSSKGQRLGDILANTVMVRSRGENSLSISDLTAIRTRDTHQIKYPMANKLTEEQALLIKNVLDRNKKYPNEASALLAKNLFTNIIVELDIRNCNQNSMDFLRSILRDYVVLTR